MMGSLSFRLENPIFLNTMKLNWIYTKENTYFLVNVAKKTVQHVAEFKSSGFVSWKGELTNDEYFTLSVTNGVVVGATDEREMRLYMKSKVLAYEERLDHIFQYKDVVKKAELFNKAKLDVIPEIMNNITFDIIMGLFGWNYASHSVEIHRPFAFV